MTTYKKILVAIDGSKNAEKSFQEAIEIAKTEDAHLIITWIINEMELTSSAYSFTKILAEEKDAVAKEMLHKVEQAQSQGIKAITPIVEVGNPKEYIATIIPEEHHPELIIIGATGKGAIQRQSIGSTTAYVVNQAPCNVLVIKE